MLQVISGATCASGKPGIVNMIASFPGVQNARIMWLWKLPLRFPRKGWEKEKACC
jgi:hypothetical protein